jgi:two-component system response regulator LytT
MTKVLIIEDEKPAARRLSALIENNLPDVVLLGPIDSVEGAIEWLKTNRHPDLIFMDIQLSDGLSFMIFNQVQLSCPVIFTTAYDDYALQAFRVSALDYLLKPVEEKLLREAIDRYLHQKKGVPDYRSFLQEYLSHTQKHGVSRLLIKSGEQWFPIEEQDVAYALAEDKYVWIVTSSGSKHLTDDSLDQLESRFSASDFFRVNRKMLINYKSLLKIHSYFNSRLKLELKPSPGEEVIVSRERVSGFKEWLNK